MIFFQWKLRLSTFQIWHLGDRGGTHIRHIWLSNNILYNRGIFPILNKECFTKSKMSLPQVPPQSPKCQIWKVWSLRLSAFTEKIMLISFFDNFLQWYEIQMFGLVFERLFQAQNQMISSTEYQTKLTKLQMNLKNYLKKIFSWFFFPVNAEIPYCSGLTLGGPRGDLGRLYFDICERCQSENFQKIKSFKVK